MQTARIIAPAVALSGKVSERPGLGPDDSVEAAARQIKNVRGDVMIVGHQPFLGKLAAKLLKLKTSDEVLKLSTSSVLALSSEDGRKWAVSLLLPADFVRSGKAQKPTARKAGRAKEALAGESEIAPETTVEVSEVVAAAPVEAAAT